MWNEARWKQDNLWNEIFSEDLKEYLLDELELGWGQKYRRVIELRYDITTGNKKRTLKEVSEKIGVGIERVRQMQLKANRFLRFKLYSIKRSKEQRSFQQPKILTIPRMTEHFEFSVRARNCLKMARILELGQLLKTSTRELKKIKNMGDKTISEIDEVLAKYRLERKK